MVLILTKLDPDKRVTILRPEKAGQSQVVTTHSVPSVVIQQGLTSMLSGPLSLETWNIVTLHVA